MTYARKLNARGVPSTFIIDRNQNIVVSGMGPLDFDRADVKKLIRSLVAQPRS
jgi:hypothetical protein